MKNAISMVVALWAVGCAVDDGAPMTEQEEQAVASGNVWHSNQKGASAYAYAYGPYSNSNIAAWEYGSGSTRTAGMQFYSWAVDPTSQVCATYDWGWGQYTYCYFTRYTYDYAWGQIPSQDFRVTGKAARLNTTITPAMYSQHCTFDASTYVYDCQAATGGAIDVTWNADGAYSSFHSGVDQQSYGTYTFRSQGQMSSASARTSGTALGVSQEGGYGTLSDSKGTTVTHDVSANP